MSLDSKKIFAQNYASYYELGYQTIPITPGTKKPAINNWSKYSNEKQTIEELDHWRETFPDHGIGLVCGPASGLTCLDIDLDLNSHMEFKLYEELDKILPKSKVSKRGEKGETRFFKFNGETSCTIKCGSKHVADLLSTGRQTVLPPSIHPNGQEYVWDEDVSILDVDITEIPILTKEHLAKILEKLAHYACLFTSEKISSGRNDALKAQVIAALYKGKSVNEIVNEIIEFDQANHSPPF
jgi:hypothetical protein